MLGLVMETVLLLSIYVDDALFCGLDIKIAKKMKAAFIKCWECRGLGPAKKFLYMNIK